MIDIITTVAMGDHVCFVDRIVIIFISLQKFIISSLVCCKIDVCYFTDMESGYSMEWKMMVL